MKPFLPTISIILMSVTLAHSQVAGELRHDGTSTNSVIVSTAYINGLLEEARTNNPALRAATSRVRAATLNAESVRIWDDPMAMFGGSVFSSRGFAASEEGDLAYGVEQRLPLWGRPKLAHRVAEAETAMRRAEVDFRIQQLRRDITKALLMTALAERVVEVGEEDLAWLDATARSVETKYRSGQAVVADTLQVQNELAKRRDTLRTDHLQLSHERLTLNRFLNRKVNSPWPPLELPPVAPAVPFSEKLLSLALANEPRIKVMEQEIKHAEAMAELTRKSRLPDVSLGVEGRQYSGDGRFRSGMFTIRFSLPWLNREKYRSDYLREKEKQRSAQEEQEDQRLMVKEELHHLTVRAEATRREALLYQDEIVTRAAQALRSRLTDWETGRGMFRDVLDARRMALDAQLMVARAISEENQALAELILWAGLEDLEALAPLVSQPPIVLHDDRIKQK